jgi:hypothetical protein
VETFTRSPGLIGEPSSNQDKQPPKFSSSQIIQTPSSGFELKTDTESLSAQWVDSLRARLEIPSDALLRHLTASGAIFGPRWQNYNLRFVGIVTQQLEQTECSWPFWRVSDMDGNGIELVQIWFKRASCFLTPVYCDVRWQPGQGESVLLVNVENARRARDITTAWRGRVLLQKIKPQGRPESSVSLTREQFVERAPQVCAKLYDTYGEIPSDVQIAEELHISRSTLYRYMAQYNMPLNEIRDTAIKMLIEPSTF